MFNLYDKVKVIENSTNKVIKRGILVDYTKTMRKGDSLLNRPHLFSFGQIYDKESEYDSLPSTSEWYPFLSPEMTIKKI